MKFKTNMTLFGKIFMVLFFFSTGLATGIYVVKKNMMGINDGVNNQVQIELKGVKSKKESNLNINLTSDQKGEKSEQYKKRRRNR
jgi:anionic cell wall polymer biosynthesis LytR-Cps2A-Psr (LCP) family protein